VVRAAGAARRRKVNLDKVGKKGESEELVIQTLSGLGEKFWHKNEKKKERGDRGLT